MHTYAGSALLKAPEVLKWPPELAQDDTPQVRRMQSSGTGRLVGWPRNESTKADAGRYRWPPGLHAGSECSGCITKRDLGR